MPTELLILSLGAILLFVHIFVATRFKTAQYGRAWNVGPRDETLPPPNEMTGRSARAQANFQETFPIAIVALLSVVVAHCTDRWSMIGGWTWLIARIAYLPIYLAGVRVVRTLIYTVSMIGLAVVLAQLFV